MRRLFRPAPARTTTRVDLHLHSRASTDTGSWFLSRAVMPESFVDPADAYRTCKARGMDMVALTDHNTIAGALEIAHHPDVIVGVEITTGFPEEPLVQLHVLAWGVTEADWAELDRVRPNVFELVAELRARNIPHALAHALHRVGDELTVDHLEICLLLFPLWEGRNGARPAVSNEVGVRIARSASPALLARLAEKHGIPACGDGPPALTGGSDDHSLLEACNAWSEFPRSSTPAEVLDHLRAGRVEMGGNHGGSTALAHSVGTLLLKQYANSGAKGVPDAMRGVFSDLIHHPLADLPSLGDAAAAPSGRGHGLGQDLMRDLRGDKRFVMRYRAAGKRPDSPERSRERLRMATSWLHERALASALSPEGFSLGRLGARVDALTASAAVAAPYFLAARWMKGERRHAVDMEREYFGVPGLEPERGRPRVLMLTDTFDALNGAAGTMRRLAAWSAAQPDRPVTVVTCARRESADPGVHRLRSVVEWPMPAYPSDDVRLAVPSLLDLLRLADESGTEVIHAATPGPLGVAGLVVARALGIPFVASHHTELAQYALDLTGDRLAAGLVGQGVGWFYGQAARVYVPSRVSGRGLMDAGVDPERVFIFGRGVDPDAFSPAHRSSAGRRRLGARGGTVVLYVGRLSAEKGLDQLADAFRRVSATRPDLTLALVGDGPHRDALAKRLAGTRHRFVGPLRGSELAEAYASADIFCLPSLTETFGQVVVEASCSGLPVIVSDRGGACEQVRAGETGLVARGGEAEHVAAAIARLADEPEERMRMGAAARAHAASRAGWDEVFSTLVSGYDTVAGHAEPAPAPARPSRLTTEGERA